jgi:hypothetical protein
MDEQNPINATDQEWQVVYVAYAPDERPMDLFVSAGAIFMLTLETVLEDELQEVN